MQEKKGRLVVISAPSGSGKTTIVKRLLEQSKNLIRSISYTTRPPRSGEVNGRDYFFISEEEFESKKRERFFLESAKVLAHSYGTSKAWVEDQVSRGRDVVLAIDVQGARQLRGLVGHGLRMISIFIVPPSIEVLRERLRRRKTETEAEIAKRLEIAKQEMAERNLYDFQVLNERLEQAVSEIKEIVECQIHRIQSKNC